MARPGFARREIAISTRCDLPAFLLLKKPRFDGRPTVTVVFYIDLRQVGVEVCIRTSNEVLKVACRKLLSPNWHSGEVVWRTSDWCVNPYSCRHCDY